MTPLCLRLGPPDTVLEALEAGVHEHIGLHVHAVSGAAEAVTHIEEHNPDPLLLLAHGHPPSQERFPDLRCEDGFFTAPALARAVRGRALLVFACWSASIPTRWPLSPRGFLGFEGWLLIGTPAERRDLLRELFEPIARALAGSLSLEDVHREWQVAATRSFIDHPPAAGGSLLPEMLAYNARAAQVSPLGAQPVWLSRGPVRPG